jgi:hypothetical protein
MRVLGFLLLAAGLQAGDFTDSNGHLWLNYVGDHPLGDSRWGIHLESQLRRAELGGDWQQLLLRPGINYTLNPNVSFSAGYAWVNTWPYGEYPVRHEFPEHRLWEQASFTHQALGLEWTHRFRLEQRRIAEMVVSDGNWSVGNWRYENRLRYMLRTTVPLSSDKNWYLALWDEVFFNFGSNVSGNHFDQNRFFVGVGRKLSATTRVELGLLEQSLQRRGGQIWEHNHTVAVWLISKWPFK